MKKKMRNCGLFVLTILAMQSCSKSNTTPASSTNPANNATFVESLNSGTWVISSFVQRTDDKTSTFNGYSFTFSKGGTLEASNSGAVTKGSWSYSPSAVGYYGGPPSNASITMNLGTASPFNRLTRTWNIDSTKTNSSQLYLLNPEPAEGEHVIFSKQ
jgi:hypothetical protein